MFEDLHRALAVLHLPTYTFIFIISPTPAALEVDHRHHQSG